MNEVVHAAGRGAIAAMAMTGMRAFTVNLGIVDQAPPQAIFKQKARGVMAVVPRKKRRAAIELFHWGYGAGGGAAFALPKKLRPVDRAGLAADHLLYGLVLSETRARPRETPA